MIIFALVAGVPHAIAADLAISGKSAQSLKASTNADTVRTLNLLRKQVDQKGSARIIVGLRVAFTPEGRLTSAEAAQQRNEIVRLKALVLEKVPSIKQSPEKIKRFDTSPFMALEVNSAELEELASLAEIVSIEEDRLAAPTFGIGVIKPESN